MGSKNKATKKFEKKHLKETLDRRKDFAKIKQRHHVADKRKARNAKKNAENDGQDESESEIDAKDDVNQDDFFQDQIAVPETGKGKKRKRVEIPQPPADPAAVNGASDPDDLEDEDEDNLEAIQAVIEKDPEFKKFLQNEDPELLDFNETDNLDAFMSDDEEERPNKKAKVEPSSQDISVDMVQRWKTSMVEQHSLRAVREVVLAFRSAAHMGDAEDKDYKYTIPSPEVYHEILMLALKELPKVLAHHLPVKESAAGKVRVPTDSPAFKKLSPLIKTYSTSLNHLLGNLSDAATMRVTLDSFQPLMPYLLQHRKFLKIMIRTISGIWADSTTTESVRVSAFLVLRRLMVIADQGVKESILKSIYEHLIKSARNTTSHTLPGINLMKNSAAELYGIDQKLAYTVSFTFIRQAAIHLRGNITKPTKDSYKTIYNWQFVHSLDFFSRVLSTHCNSLLEAQQGKTSELRPLIYPVVQITLGIMRLIPTPAYFPLRFQLIRSLLRISQATGTYIPLASHFLEVLQHPDMRKLSKPAPTTLRALDFSTHIRAPAADLKTRIYQDGVGDQITELLGEFLVLWCKHIAYPEFAVPLTVMLKRWLKNASKAGSGNKNGKLNQGLLLVVQKSEANAKWIKERRDKVQFSPRDRVEVDNFLKDTEWASTPLGAFVKGQRELREQRAKVVRQSQDEEKRRAKQNVGGDDEDIEMG